MEWTAPPGLEEDISRLKSTMKPMEVDEQHRKKILTSLFRDRSIFDQLKKQESRRFEAREEVEVLNEWLKSVHQMFNNIVLDTMYGILLWTSTCCACGSSSFTFSLFSGIQVDIQHFNNGSNPSSPSFVSIDRLIAHSFSPDYEEEVWCAKCRHQQYHIVSKQIYRHPLILIVDLEKQRDKEKKNVYVQLKTSSMTLDDHSVHSSREYEYVLRGYVCMIPSSYGEGGAMYRDYHLSYYTDTKRRWTHVYSSDSVYSDTHVSDGINHLSYCLYEYI